VGQEIIMWHLTDPNDCPECFGDMKFEKTDKIIFSSQRRFWKRVK